MTTRKRYVKIIAENFPLLQVRLVKSLGEGWGSVAILVNERYVFRFPKTDEAAQDLEKEIRLLPKLSRILSLQIPQFTFIGKSENGFSFVGYEIISGELLSVESFSKLSKTERNRIADQLVRFMKEMQSFSTKETQSLHVPTKDLASRYLEYRKNIREHYVDLPSEVVEYIERRFGEFFDSKQYMSSPFKLVHGDFAINHFIFDPIKRELSGIIDFGDAEVSDPDYDYLYLLRELDREFVERVMDKMGVKNIDEKIRKVGYLVTFNYVNDIIVSYDLNIPSHWKTDAIEALRKEAYPLIAVRTPSTM